MEVIPSQRIAFVGAGNVATHLAVSLYAVGWDIVGVYSRTYESATALASRVCCVATDSLNSLPEADIYLFSVVDNVLPALLMEFSRQDRKGLWLHTAGSVPLSVFEGIHADAGVLYPMQTFSKQKAINISQVPLFIEATNEASMAVLQQLAQSISSRVEPLDSVARGRMHVAAVFACNFVNHCYAQAALLMEESGLPFSLLLPLIDETAQKVHHLSPKLAQTGPAVRRDTTVLERHAALLDNNPFQQELYQLISRGIRELSASVDTLNRNDEKKVL